MTVCALRDTFLINWGSDLTAVFNWPDGSGGDADLTGWTVDAIDVHPALVGFLTVTLTDPPTGEITISVQWDDTMPYGRVMRFRVRISLGGQEATTNRLWVKVQ